MLYDKDIREPLFDFLEEKYGKVRILEEKTMGRSRADVVMVLDNEVIGIEIKSDADTYARLASQVKDYDKFCDKNYVVIGSSHVAHIDEHIPKYWGVISVEMIGEKIDFLVVRETGDNPKLKIKNKLSILWRPELAHIQELCKLPKYKGKSKDFVIGKLIEKVPEDELHRCVSEELFERDYNTIAEVINDFKKKR